MKAMNVLMILFVGVCLLSLVGIAKAEGPVYDPTINPTATLVCTLPVTREDGSPLAVDEIALIRFVQSGDGQTWAQAGTNTECSLVLDLTSMPEGQYYYSATAVDTDGRESQRATAHPFVLRRIQPPTPPTGLMLVL